MRTDAENKWALPVKLWRLLHHKPEEVLQKKPNQLTRKANKIYAVEVFETYAWYVQRKHVCVHVYTWREVAEHRVYVTVTEYVKHSRSSTK